MNALEDQSVHREWLARRVTEETKAIRGLLVRLELTDNLGLSALEDRLDRLENLRTKAGWMLSKKD